MVYQAYGLKFLAHLLKERQNNKFDGLIVFDGPRGLGKSTGAVKLALMFPQFKMKRDMVFSRDDVIKAISIKKHSVILADEMINVTYNRDFYAEDQKKLLKMLNMYRDSCNILIACVPNFYDLDKQFRALVRWRINVTQRGLAVWHIPNNSAYKNDKWDSSLNEKIETKWAKSGKPRYNKLTTYAGMIKYGDLGKRQRILYEKLKAEKRNHLVMDDLQQEDDGKLSTKDTARLYAIDSQNGEKWDENRLALVLRLLRVTRKSFITIVGEVKKEMQIHHKVLRPVHSNSESNNDNIGGRKPIVSFK